MSPAAIELYLGRPGLDPELGLELGLDLELDVSYVMTKESLSPWRWCLARVRKWKLKWSIHCRAYRRVK